ncbi:MAG: hypothetical protein AAFV19_08535 [Pseudomonadota bacterium]
MRWLISLVLLLAPFEALAQQAIDPADARLELHLEDRPHLSHPDEMVLLSIQGTFRIPVVREKLIQPDLTGLDWMQLGEDRWYKEMEDGFEVLKFERRMALFPQAPGEIEIAPFTHRLDLLNRRGREMKTELVSDTATLKSVPGPESEDWWFPVRALEVNDSWSNQPEALDPGSAALRIVALTIDGSPPQRIPPMPEMTGAGAHIFPHPEHRIVALGPDGPRTRVFWRWTIRPEQGSAGYLDPIRLTYFDAQTRETKEITLSAQRVAYLGGPQQVTASSGHATDPVRLADGEGISLPTVPGFALPLMLGLGLLAGMATAFGRGAWQLPRRVLFEWDLAALRSAARRGDVSGVRKRAYRTLTVHGAPVPDAVLDLDRALYGPHATKPDLAAVASSVRRAAKP